MEEVNINVEIDKFINFLNSSWEAVGFFIPDDGTISEKYDWLQAN